MRTVAGPWVVCPLQHSPCDSGNGRRHPIRWRRTRPTACRGPTAASGALTKAVWPLTAPSLWHPARPALRLEEHRLLLPRGANSAAQNWLSERVATGRDVGTGTPLSVVQPLSTPARCRSLGAAEASRKTSRWHPPPLPRGTRPRPGTRDRSPDALQTPTCKRTRGAEGRVRQVQKKKKNPDGETLQDAHGSVRKAGAGEESRLRNPHSQNSDGTSATALCRLYLDSDLNKLQENNYGTPGTTRDLDTNWVSNTQSRDRSLLRGHTGRVVTCAFIFMFSSFQDRR